MEGFTLVDGGALLIVAISALLAFSRGFVREVLSILGWVVAAVAAFYFAGNVEPLIREIPVLSDVIGGSCELSILIAFAAVFAVALIVVSIFTPLFSGIVQNSALGPMDQGLGFLFGVARGVLLVAIALIVYEKIVGDDRMAMVTESKTKEILASTQASLEQQIPEDAPAWVADRFEQLTGSCGDTGTASDTAPETAPDTAPTVIGN